VSQSSSLRLRLGLRDLAGAAAFASMAISGAVPSWAVLAFAAGLVLALLNVRPLARHATLSALLLVGGASLLYSAVAVGRLDLVLAACTFAGLIALFRILASPDPKTDGQVHLTNLLMLCGGAALSGEMLFGLCVVAFALLSTLSLGLGVVQSAQSDDQPVPTRAVAGQLLVGGFCAVLGSIALFASIPRISWNVASKRPAPGAAMSVSGMSDRVTLRGTGRIKTNPRIVARTKIAPDPGSAGLDAYWLGRTFDTFNGHEWSNARAMASSGKAEARWGIELRRWSGPSARQDIELLPGYGSRTLIALETPVSFANAMARTADGSRRTQLVEVAGEEVHFEEPSTGYTYEAKSGHSPFRSSEAETDLAAPRNLQLPPELDPRVRQLAQTIAGKETDPVEVAHRLEHYLKSQYRYGLSLPGEPADPLLDFLFVRKEGHCEQFATALVIMLRTLGIPSRLATGFYGGERIRDRYVLRAGDAHAWTQLVLPGRPVLSLDATPEESRAMQTAAILDWILRSYETLSERWRSSVVDYSMHDQEELAHGLAALRPASGRRWPIGTPWLAAAAAALALALTARRWAREARVRGHEATALLERAEGMLARAGVHLEAGECFEELVSRLAATPIARALDPLARRYLQARFGERPLRSGEAAALLRTLSRSASAEAETLTSRSARS
jgi:hypothetical protein